MASKVAATDWQRNRTQKGEPELFQACNVLVYGDAMQATKSAPERSSKGPRVGIVVLAGAGPRPDQIPYLATLLKNEGYNSFRARAAYLGCSTAALHRAWNGEPARDDLIAGARIRFPEVPYERMFREVAADVPADRAA